MADTYDKLQPGGKSRLQRLVYFSIGIFIIYVMVFQLGPFITNRTDDPVLRYAIDQELDTGTLFYTESEEGMEANYLMIKSASGHSN